MTTESNIDQTLAERGQRYGEFDEHARITQNIKRAMIDSPNWTKLSDDKKEALDMVAHKIGRILNGDPEYHDSWHDLVGYAKLVADALRPGLSKATYKAAPEAVLTDFITYAEQINRVTHCEK